MRLLAIFTGNYLSIKDAEVTGEIIKQRHEFGVGFDVCSLKS